MWTNSSMNKPFKPRGGLPYKSDGDARRLALGCKLQILVSLRVFGMEIYCICPFRYGLVLCRKKFTEKCPDTDHTEIPFRGQFKLKPHAHWSTLGYNLNFPTSIPAHFIWESPAGFQIIITLIRKVKLTMSDNFTSSKLH